MRFAVGSSFLLCERNNKQPEEADASRVWRQEKEIVMNNQLRKAEEKWKIVSQKNL